MRSYFSIDYDEPPSPCTCGDDTTDCTCYDAERKLPPSAYRGVMLRLSHLDKEGAKLDYLIKLAPQTGEQADATLDMCIAMLAAQKIGTVLNQNSSSVHHFAMDGGVLHDGEALTQEMVDEASDLGRPWWNDHRDEINTWKEAS